MWQRVKGGVSPLRKISDKILFPFLFSPLTHSPRQDMGVGSAGTKDPEEEEECEGVGHDGQKERQAWRAWRKQTPGPDKGASLITCRASPPSRRCDRSHTHSGQTPACPWSPGRVAPSPTETVRPGTASHRDQNPTFPEHSSGEEKTPGLPSVAPSSSQEPYHRISAMCSR